MAVIVDLVDLCDAAAAVKGGGIGSRIGQRIVFKEGGTKALAKVGKGRRDAKLLASVEAGRNSLSRVGSFTADAARGPGSRELGWTHGATGGTRD